MFELKRSRYWLFIAWVGPLLIYFALALSLPYIHEGRVDSVQIFGVLYSLGQVFIPVIMVFLAFYFPGNQSNSQLTLLTRERFWTAFGAIGGFHVVMLTVFLVLVVCVDYTNPETYQESVEGRIEQFSKLALYFSLPLIFPVRALFQRV